MKPRSILSAPKSFKADAPRTDAEHMKAIAAGDLGALGALYDRHHREVRAFARRCLGGSPTAADDIVQETFLTVPSVASGFDGRESARPLLLGIAARLVRRRGRSVARLARALSELAHNALGRVRTPEEVASDHEGMAALDAALQRLSEEKRIVFLLIEREGLSGEEVATSLGIPVATVWTRLHYTRTELRRALNRGKRP